MAMNGAYFNDLDAAGQQSALAHIPGSATTDYILFNLNVPSDTKADITYGWNPDRVLASNGQLTAEAVKILIPIVQAGVTKGKCQRVWLAIGATGSPFKNIQTILNAGGVLKSILLMNFHVIVQAVKSAGVQEVGLDMDYDEDPRMIAPRVGNVTSALYDALKCPVTFRPNEGLLPGGQSAWIQALRQVYANLGMKTQCVVGFNLQTYRGGRGNVPAEWMDAIKNTRGTGVTDPAAFVWPVVSCDDTAQPVTPADKLAQTLKDWQSKGASLWAMQPLGQKPADLKAYSAAIAQGIA